MADRVVIDEWTVMVFGAPTLSARAADQVRDVVERELAATARRLTRAVDPAATVELLPR